MIKASDELEELTRQLYRAVELGDAAMLRQRLSSLPEAVFIGTDPDEWWHGAEALVRAATAQAAAMGGQIKIEPGQIRAYRDGDFGWSFDTGPTFKLPDGTEVSARSTNVFVREHGEWRVVHSHASIGIPNEDSLGEDITRVD